MATRYGLAFQDNFTDLDIELYLIAQGGHYMGKGLGLFEHFMRARKLAWPDRYRHEWTDLLYQNFIANDITVMMGAASTNKTSHAAEYAVLRFLSSPSNTLVMLSTIDMDKLDTGIWAEVKMLWSMCKERYPNIAGNIIDHRRCIAYDSVEQGDVRDLRRGILSRPCYVGGQWVGLGKLAGTKQDNIVYIADELQFMAETFIKSWANLFSNGNVKIIGSGNPKHDLDDQLALAAEPEDGWQSIGEPQTTTVWKTRFMGGKCVNLVGIDSPNFRAVAKGKPEPYKKLIGPKFAERIAHDYGLNSPEYYTQVKGVMLMGDEINRVITRQSCRDHGALNEAKWAGMSRTKVHGLDPSYGGRDACVSTILEFGADPDGKQIMRYARKVVHRFVISNDKSVEDQIAEQVFDLLKNEGIPSSQSGYDPYGKGTIGFAFSRKFGSDCPIPIDSGGKPTERPVRQDLYVIEKDGTKRLKKCSEEYSKFVTEAWFSVRYIIEADQMRELPEDVMAEGCSRIYSTVAGNKKEVEPKDDLKERTGKSPNLFDSLSIAVEMARRHGFKIGRLGVAIDNLENNPFKWLADRRRQHADLLDKKRLTYA